MSQQLSTYASDEQRVKDLLNKCGLNQYYERFAEEGFDQLKSLYDITEDDLSALNVKRGHRRVHRKGLPSSHPLLVERGYGNKEHHSPMTAASTSGYSSMASFNTGQDAAGSLECSSSISSTEDDTSSSSPLTKRKYRRHAKPDKNAPIKPPSAYVMFSNDVRKELKDYNMSFTELARIVGNRWKNIESTIKQTYEDAANAAKDEYLRELSEYQKTEEYMHYQKYLTEFRSKQDAAARAVGRPRKRVKTESPSSGSIADSSSNGNGAINGNSSNGHGFYSNATSNSGSQSHSSFSSAATTPNFFTRKADVGRLSSERLAAQDAYYNRSSEPSTTPYLSRSTNAATTPSSSISEGSPPRAIRRNTITPDAISAQPESDVRSDEGTVPVYKDEEKIKSNPSPPSSSPITHTPRINRRKSFHLRS
ncbi:hypothetical protein INT44_003447 [Umbelopsis vinacea]|uniref:HMG box domain-containing protein n=1 Tax=Umbelopsis vinacea TaxID=44442 RepID=A0A8H7UHW0_9FUNG|nr:hypothetical protein INT44_003447 [Umbelopsis vinacea]